MQISIHLSWALQYLKYYTKFNFKDVVVITVSKKNICKVIVQVHNEIDSGHHILNIYFKYKKASLTDTTANNTPYPARW